MRYVGIDIGSSHIKLTIFDLDKGVMIHKMVIKALPWKEQSRKGRFEIEAKKMVVQIKNLLDQALNQFQEISGIMFSTQMHGFILETDTSLEPVYVSWQDRRSLEAAPGGGVWLDQLQTVISPDRMKCTGVPIKSSLALANLYVMMQEYCYASSKCRFYTLGSYLIWQLTGQHCCHIQNAAATGLLDVSNGCWDQNILLLAGLDGMVLPRLMRDFEACGSYRYQGRDITVFPDFGDQQVTILGCHPADHDFIINIGTAAQIATITDQFLPGHYELRPYFDHKYLKTVTNLPGGRDLDILIQWIIEIGSLCGGVRLEPDEVWKRLKLSDCPLTTDLQVNAQFFGTADNRQSGGAITNITASNLHVQELFLAAFQNMAASYQGHASSILLADQKPNQIIFAGGFILKQPLLADIIQETFKIPSVISQNNTTVFNGMFRICQVCAGIADDLAGTVPLVEA